MVQVSQQSVPLSSGEEETLRAYYLLQYGRVAQHENQRLQVSNYVMATSVIGIGVLTASSPSIEKAMIIATLVAVIAVNIAAILYAARSRHWVKFHQLRARSVLEEISPKLVAIQRADGKINSETSWLRGQLVQSFIHIVVALLATALIGAVLVK